MPIHKEGAADLRKKILYVTTVILLWSLLMITALYLVVLIKDKSSTQTEGNVNQNNRAEERAAVETPFQQYDVYVYNQIKASFDTLEAAIAFSKTLEHASVRDRHDKSVYWNNYSAYTIYQQNKFIADFDSFSEAVQYAKKYSKTSVYYEEWDEPIWFNQTKLAEKVLVDVPLISQMPELPRGCEVTSLAMLLLFAGVETSKMKLAEEIKKDPTSYRKINGETHYGNPYDGFIGDMYSFSNPGYGVYHGPIRELAEKYLPDQIIDMTGSEFQDILFSLNRGVPVWLIANTKFSRLPDSLFQTWQTPTGPLQITYKEHSVLLTGYDQNFVYFNDPLANVKNRKVDMKSFEEAWVQMGRQAITLIESNS